MRLSLALTGRKKKCPSQPPLSTCINGRFLNVNPLEWRMGLEMKALEKNPNRHRIVKMKQYTINPKKTINLLGKPHTRRMFHSMPRQTRLFMSRMLGPLRSTRHLAISLKLPGCQPTRATNAPDQSHPELSSQLNHPISYRRHVYTHSFAILPSLLFPS